MRLFVGNLPYETTERELRDLFASYACNDATIVFDPATGLSRGFGYVWAADEKAIADLDGQPFNGRKLHVERAREWSKQPKGEFERRRRA